MGYCGYVTTLKNVRKHPNADRLVLADCFGNTVCVANTYKEGDIGVYFPVDLQLSTEFCQANGLLAVYENGVNVSGGYMDPEKRNVKAIKLRGEKSDGLFLPLTCFEYTGIDISTLGAGTQITVVNGKEICQKYIPKAKHPATSAGGAGKRTARRAKRSIAPVFYEHKDTEQLAYNLAAFKPGDLIEITLKMHGTSGRTSHTKVLKGFKRTLWDRLLRREGTPIYDWGYVTGTRRTVLDTFDGGFYGSNEFRKQYHDHFEGKLLKGETVYYEIVGFTHDGGSIMGKCSNSKVKDKEFAKQYGEETVFSYGCEPHPETWVPHDHCDQEKKLPQSDMYVYRMTMTNEDGDVVEYTPDFMRYRCEQMGVKCVPVFWTGIIPENPGSKDDPTISAGEWILNKAELFYDGPDPVGKTHIREGVVVRILNRPTFAAYKHKNHTFKMLSGIIVEAVADGEVVVDATVLEEL